MLDKYYKDRYFLTALVAFILLFSQNFSLWSTQQTNTGHPFAWIVLLVLFVPSLTVLYYPTQKVQLSPHLVPLIILLTLWALQYALTLLPHNMTLRAALWPMMFMNITCIGLILRHHPVAAWGTFFMAAILCVSWHSKFYAPYTSVALLFCVPAVLLIVAQVVISQVDEYQLKEKESEDLLKKAEDRSVQEQGVSFTAERRVKEVRALAEDMLYRIAYDPTPVTREEINDFRFAEAQLRDTIRGRYIVNEQILQATWAARKRGTKVDILDERGEALPEHITDLLTEAAVDTLDEARRGTVTIRAFPKDDPTAVMIVHDDEDEGTAIEISQEGLVERF